MTDLKKVRLGDVCILEKGTQIDTSQLENSKPYRYINGGIKESGYYDKFNTSGESVLISEGGASCGYINYVNENFWCGCHCYRLHDIKVFPKYLYYALKGNQDRIMSLRTGSTMPNIQKTIIQKFELSIHNQSETQKQIAATLDKVSKIIAENKKLLEKYDLLIKSRFIEMFGDPVQNPFNWEIYNLGSFIKYANNGMSRRGNDKNGNIVLRLVELQRGFLDLSECNRIEIKSNEEKYLLKNNDFLFARVNGNPDNVGRCCYFKDIGEPVYYNDHIIRVHFDEKKLNEYYLNTVLNSEYGKSEFKKYIKTSAGQYTIAHDGISSAQILVPPLSLQNTFAAFVQQIDKSKFAVQKSLEKAETLYKFLMQRYFA